MSILVRPSASYSLTLRLRISNTPGSLGRVTSMIGDLGGSLGAIDIKAVTKTHKIRDITLQARDEEHGESIVEHLKTLGIVDVLNVSDRTFLLHIGGKIRITSKSPVVTRDDLSMAYTPGVGRVCMAIHKDPAKAYKLTIKANTVAIVSDGTAVLGLGDIGPEAAMPVMEGKAMLFKEFGNVDAFPICLDTKDTEEIIRTVKNIAPGFGGINLEDISAPRCFEIEARLKKELNIPVFHDDQHGTAVVVLAALTNAMKLVHKEIKNLKIVVTGVGAAGVACSKMIMAAGATNLIGFDRTGAIHKGRTNLNYMKQWFAENTNPAGFTGTVKQALEGADLFLGLSGPGVIEPEDLAKMNKDAIVFAMANPTPEVMPEEAAPYVRIMATGRSDYPNQINNVLCFPGIFRGALDCLATDINDEMTLAAAAAIAGAIPPEELAEDYIIPGVFDRRVATAVAAAVVKAAIETGVARRIPGMEEPAYEHLGTD
ncbi:MAG: NAD-dependent malic enzyme [Candidatus Korobacteraceae bacterium]